MSNTQSTTYLSTIPMGRVTRWKNSKESAITPIPFPAHDAHLTEGIDTLGVIKLIEFSGRFTGGFNTVQNFINDVEQILDGYQYAAHTLYSPFINGRFLENPSVQAGVRKQGRIATNTAVTTNLLIDNTANFGFNGVRAGDLVRNLNTGAIAEVTSVSTTSLTLNQNIFTTVGTPYAVAVSIRVKILKFDTRWELPGLTYCDYDIELMQVR